MWLGWDVVMPRDLLGHYYVFLGLGADRRVRYDLTLVWHIVLTYGYLATILSSLGIPFLLSNWCIRLNYTLENGSVVRILVTHAPFMSGK
jgi:hypothetical protein